MYHMQQPLASRDFNFRALPKKSPLPINLAIRRLIGCQIDLAKFMVRGDFLVAWRRVQDGPLG